MDWSRLESFDDTPSEPPAYNGFDLSTCLIPSDEVVSGGPLKDTIPAITQPKFNQAAEADRFVSDDSLVIGVQSEGEAKAYPLSILESHECINDVLAGLPIAVTYHALCRSAVVFARQERVFGISGLLWNSNALLYNRQEEAKEESLYSQVGLRAISGPAAEDQEKLEPLPCALMTWQRWRSLHADTLILSADTGYRFNYNPAFSQFKPYYSDERLLFPVKMRAPKPEHLRLKEPLLAVQSKKGFRGYVVAEVGRLIDQQGYFVDNLDDVEMQLGFDPVGRSLYIESFKGGNSAPASLTLYWFAASALIANLTLFDQPANP